MRLSPVPSVFRLMFSSAILALIGFSGMTGARAEPVPLPAVDFEATATMMGKGTFTLHHSGDKARVEMQMGPVPVTGIMDLKTRKMYLLGAIPGMGNMAMEVGIGDASYGQAYGSGHRVGEDTVAGEPCELWEMDSAKSEHENRHFGGPIVVCLSNDHIPLRTEATVEGKRKIITQVTEVKRVKQDPSLLVLPKDVQVMKMPKGMGEGIAGSMMGKQ